MTRCAIPTEKPQESDGTIVWDHTTLILVEAEAGDKRGLGFTYGHESLAGLVRDTLSNQVEGKSALDVPACWQAMVRSVRNIGRPGMALMAISAVDFALWDLKARLLGVSLLDLLGAAREEVPIYGSGGFTSYSVAELQQQLGGWASQGMRWVKMKVGREPGRDLERVRAARAAIGARVGLFVDANGAYSAKQALGLAEGFGEQGVSWFEEPVSSDDLAGLALIRARAPEGMDVAAGEYGFDAGYFRKMLEAGAVDVLQADATRCGGITGFRQAAALCAARQLPLSAHCAPSMHAVLGCACPEVRHLEFFHDHARIERRLFDGFLEPQDGVLRPDRGRPGFGLELRRAEMERLAA